MKCLPMTPENARKVKDNIKTETRRLGKCRYKVGDVCYIGEPSLYEKFNGDDWVIFKEDQELDIQKMFKWRPAWLLKAKDARAAVEITSIEEEELQQIDTDGFKAEGVYPDFESESWSTLSRSIQEVRLYMALRRPFIKLWDSINPKKNWASNPMITVVKFKLIDKK